MQRSLSILLPFLVGIAFTGGLRVASAQEEEPSKAESEPLRRVYQAAGAPSDPKVSARWNRFHDYGQATELLKQIAAAYPEICRLESLGKSYGGRDMWLMTITDFSIGDADKKPAFWIDGGIHANEIQSVEVVLYTAWYLAEMNARTPVITRLPKERTFYLLPMMSPDSRDAHMYEPNTTHSPRSGQIPVDDDLDGLVDEDGPNDLDGDGHITQMRIRDPHGSHKPHPDFPDLLVPVKPGERGQFTLLGEEGYDTDGDGRINEDGDGYYDPNRDWPWNWQPKSVQRGAYHYPFSIPENRLVGDFIMSRPNIAAAQSYHNSGGMLLRGPGGKNDRMEPDDLRVYDQIGKQGAEMLPGYRYLELATGLYEAFGSEIDWFYGMMGVLAFTNELNTPFNLFRNHDGGGGWFGSPEAVYKFDRLLLFGDGLARWTEVDHPQFGKIEVGGLKKNWRRQPPSFMLEEECHRNMAFTLFHADAMPLVEIESVDVEPLGAGLKQVSAVVLNPKTMATRTQRDVQKKITPPDRVSIAGDDLQVLAAMTSGDIVFRDPVEHKRRPDSLRIETLQSMKPLYVRWIVRGQGPLTVTVKSIKGGTAEKSWPGELEE